MRWIWFWTIMWNDIVRMMSGFRNDDTDDEDDDEW